jgi:hypothetical protein
MKKNSNTKKKNSKYAVELTAKLHKDVKKLAAEEVIPMKKWIIKAVKNQIARDRNIID